MQRSVCLSSVWRQKGLTTSHLHIQLDPFASRMTIWDHIFPVQVISYVIHPNTNHHTYGNTKVLNCNAHNCVTKAAAPR